MNRILVIEDDPAGAQLLVTLLGLEGYQCSMVEDLSEPLVEVDRQRPDLVMLDVRLGVQDGFELLGKLRAHPDPAVADTPVLMMSAEDHWLQCQDAGANGFLEKPFGLDVLRETIQKAMEVSVSED